MMSKQPPSYNEACVAVQQSFLRMLRTRNRVAFEAAMATVPTSGIDRRKFGWIAAKLHRDGVIVPAGFRPSGTAAHHRGIKRMWRLVKNVDASVLALASDSKTNFTRKKSNV